MLGTSGDKNAVDKHHIFPKHYLETIGYTDDRDRNQIANFTYLDYTTNIDISDNPLPAYRHKKELDLHYVETVIADQVLSNNNIAQVFQKSPEMTVW